jgi:hypothetical protein
MCRTDISKYYASIQTDLLQESLLMNGCDSQAVASVLAVLKFWQKCCGLKGLPIGPEASRVLGNFFLRPIDNLMAMNGARYKRYGDDRRLVSMTFIRRCEPSRNPMIRSRQVLIRRNAAWLPA